MVNPVCIKTPLGFRNVVIDGQPAALIAAVWWIEPPHLLNISIAQMITLKYDPPTRSWLPTLTSKGYELGLVVTRLIAPDDYDLVLTLWRNGAYIDDTSWHSVFITDVPVMRSIKFEHHWIPGIAYDGCHVMQ